MTLAPQRLPLLLLLMRLSVLLVMFVWTLDKFLYPDHAAAVFEKFYFISGLGNLPIYIIGAVQLAIILAFGLGVKKKISYFLVLFMHSISTFSSFKQYLAPYETPNLLFFAAWPMLVVCLTLFMLRDLDTIGNISPKLS